MNDDSKLASEIVSNIMDETRELSDLKYIDCLEDIISQLQDAVDVKKQEMEDPS